MIPLKNLKKQMVIPKNIYFKLRALILPVNEILSFIPKRANILDLGCGKGLLLENLKYYKSYTGVDLSVPELETNMPNINFIKGDCVNYIDKELEDYDTFLLIDLLHHIKPNQQLIFIQKLLNRMKRNDILIIKDIYPKNILTKFWNAFHDLIISKQLIYYFDFNEMFKTRSNNSIIIHKFHKRIFLYDHFFLVIKRN